MNDYAQHSFFLPTDGCALAATLFVPAAVRGTALFIPPFAEERKGVLPVYVQTARALAQRGIASLLFDFSGCGDSEDDFAAVPPDRFAADAETARSWLTAAFPALPVALLGTRTGALLAACLASAHPDTAALALWAPVDGADFVKQLLQRRMVNDMVAYGKARESRAALDARLTAGETVDLDGYLVTSTFCAWLKTLAPQPVRVPLLLASGGHDEKTATVYGATAATHLGLRFPPFWNTVGHVDLSPLIAQTVDWLAERFSAEARSVPSPVLPPQPNCLATAVFGDAPNAVRAVWDAPQTAPVSGVLFLHGWSGDRTGPHRLFVRFARQLAAAGALCLRPDFYGRGLSDGAAENASIARMTDDAKTALDALKQRLPPRAPITVVAICSGCKVALSLAADRPADIVRLVLWSAESMGSLRSSATGTRKTLSALSAYGRKLLRPETWKKILGGKVRTDLVAKALVKHETRSAEEARREDETLRRLRSFRSPVRFVFGGSDPDAVGSRSAYAAFCTKHGIPFSVHTVPHAGHSYYGEAWTQDLLAASLGDDNDRA